MRSSGPHGFKISEHEHACLRYLLILLVALPQLCQEHGISKDGILQDFATQVSTQAPAIASQRPVFSINLC